MKPPKCPNCSGREWGIYRDVTDISYYDANGMETSRSTSDCHALEAHCSSCGYDPMDEDDDALFDAVLALEES